VALTPRTSGGRYAPRISAQIALVLALGCALMAAAGACADDSTATPEVEDGGGEGGSVSRDDCPAAAPVNGSVCLLPEGTTCDFGLCGTRLARCSQGVWQLGANAAPRPPCPADPPSTDIPCPACWPVAVSCTYGSTDCRAEDASLNTAIASCPNGTWVIDIRPCRDGGGPDVQGDGEPDAD
jgi:hypothetical protein